MKKLFLAFSIFFSCVNDKDINDKKSDLQNNSNFTDVSISELTPEQAAFDALNVIQVSTDEINRFYSIFSGHEPSHSAGLSRQLHGLTMHSDTFFLITQSELLIFMKKFVIKHCKGLTVEVRNELVKNSVLAQEEYIIFLFDNPSKQNYKNGIPMTGTWVIQNVLGRRDIILVW
jgi:hypothetical protein